MLEIKPLFGLPLDFPHTNLDFLHTNLVPSSTYKEVDRFTNERHSTTMKTIGLSRFARALLIRIGSCRIYSIFQIKAGRFRKRYRSCNRFAGKIYLRDFQFIRNRFIVKMASLTVKDIEGALNVCVTVRDWGTLTKSIQIPQVMAPFACLRKRLFTFYHHGYDYILFSAKTRIYINKIHSQTLASDRSAVKTMASPAKPGQARLAKVLAGLARKAWSGKAW